MVAMDTHAGYASAHIHNKYTRRQCVHSATSNHGGVLACTHARTHAHTHKHTQCTYTHGSIYACKRIKSCTHSTHTKMHSSVKTHTDTHMHTNYPTEHTQTLTSAEAMFRHNHFILTFPYGAAPVTLHPASPRPLRGCWLPPKHSPPIGPVHPAVHSGSDCELELNVGQQDSRQWRWCLTLSFGSGSEPRCPLMSTCRPPRARC